MQEQTVEHKQTSKSWVAAESLLKITGSSNQYALIPHSSAIDFTNTNSFSFSCVIAPTSTAGVIFYKRNTTTLGDANFDGYGLYYDGTNLQFIISSGGVDKNTFIPCPYNRLHHVAISCAPSGGNMVVNIYLNGVLANTNTIANSAGFNNTRPLCVGRYYGNSTTLQNTCSVAFISIYNKALSQVEVSQLYDQVGLVPKSLHTNCIGFWTMQERYGNKAYDSVEQFNYAKKNVQISAANGNFDSGHTWTLPGLFVVSGTKLTKTTGNPGFSEAYVSLVNAPVNGVGTYSTVKISFTVTNYDKGTYGADAGLYIKYGGTEWAYNTVNITGNGTYTANLIHSQSGDYLLKVVSYKMEMFEIDNITIVDLDQKTSNHADLISYTDAELGITDKTTQTAKLDFYTKTTASFWNGSGNDLKSGLPELKNALKIGKQTQWLSINAGQGDSDLILRDLFTQNNVSITFQFRIVDNGVLVRHYLMRADQDGPNGITVMLSSQSGGTGSPPAIKILKEGSTANNISLIGNYNNWNTLTIVKEGTKETAYLNGVSYNLSISCMTTTNIRWFIFNTSQNLDFNVQSAAIYIYNRTLSFTEHLNTHNNSILTRPITKRNLLLAADFTGISSSTILDVSGNNRHLAMTGFSADEVNPAHVDYAIKTINSLR